jgi:ferredoxin-type protein NapF
MSSPIRRSDLLRGALHAKAIPLRPPWAIAEASFADACTRCDDCLTGCPESILVRGRGGFPEIDFRKGACSFCGDCAGACKAGALKRAEPDSPWRLKARVSAKSCLSMRGVTCRVCGDRCDSRAIAFTLATGGCASPRVAFSACTGCGACVASCPTDAIEMFHSDREDRA